MVDHTWVSDGADVASTAAAWNPATAPGVGDNLIFNATHVGNCTFDTARVYGSITVATGYSGTITQGAVNIGYTDLTLATGNTATWTGVITNTQTCSGDFLQQAGTVTTSVLNLILTGTNKTITTTATLASLQISGFITSADSFVINNAFVIDVNKSFTIAATKTVTTSMATGGTYNYYGDVFGTGILLMLVASDITLGIAGHVCCPVVIAGVNSALDKILTLSGSGILGSTLVVSSGHAVNTMTLDLAGSKLIAWATIIAARGVIKSSVAGAELVITDFTISADGTLTEANIYQITIKGSADLSVGTYTPSATRWIFTGDRYGGALAKTLKLAAGHKLYDVVTTSGADLRISSNVTVSNELVMVTPINRGAFTLTHEAPDKLFDQRRMHNNMLIYPAANPVDRGDMILNYLSGRMDS